MVEGALEVGHRDALVDDEPLHLVEDRAVRGVVLVGAEDPARADDVDRGLAREHRARLDRRGVGAQHEVVVGRVGPERVLHRARGWSGPRLRASKLSHSASSTGPSATSQPMATKMSAISSEPVVTGCRAPSGTRSVGSVTSTVSSTSIRCSCSASSTSCRWASACCTAPRAWPTRWPASLRACGGSAPISRLARASGERSPVWSIRTCLSASRSAAPAIAASAASRAASISSGFNAATSTGSKSVFGPDTVTSLGTGPTRGRPG